MLSRRRIRAIIGGCALALVWVAPAPAQELRASTGVICDTQKQLETFIGYAEAEPATAFAKVNAEANNPNACAQITVAFLLGEKVSEMQVKNGRLNIHEITVVGFNKGEGWQRLPAPLAQFAAFPIKELSA